MIAPAFLKGTITVNNGDTVATISGATSELLDRGSALFIREGGVLVAGEEALEGSSSNQVQFVEPWSQGNYTNAEFFAFNTIEGLIRLIREVTALGTDLGVYADAFNQVLTSTDETITLETSGGDVTLTPWGYLKQQFESESSGLLTEFEVDLKRNKLLALAGIVL